ncbi:hypothetical protein K501DRAFT_279509 [Backusella circina FSU 941]|nr:hypothetical protein K501DRAFT_279509 [Backusella circina FSU 941]
MTFSPDLEFPLLINSFFSTFSTSTISSPSVSSNNYPPPPSSYPYNSHRNSSAASSPYSSHGGQSTPRHHSGPHHHYHSVSHYSYSSMHHGSSGSAPPMAPRQRFSWAPEQEKEIERYHNEYRKLCDEEYKCLESTRKSKFELEFSSWETSKLERQLELVQTQWDESSMEDIVRGGRHIAGNSRPGRPPI